MRAGAAFSGTDLFEAPAVALDLLLSGLRLVVSVSELLLLLALVPEQVEARSIGSVR